MSHVNVDCVLDIKASLGESPIWSVKDQILYWVDINNHLICKFHPRDKENSVINVGDFIGCFALKKNLNIVLALTNGFFELEQQNGIISFVCNPKDYNPENRFNDGTVDKKGRFYAGTMSLNPTKKTEKPKKRIPKAGLYFLRLYMFLQHLRMFRHWFDCVFYVVFAFGYFLMSWNSRGDFLVLADG